MTSQAAQSKWRPYPQYKDSGVEWLGEIPAGWRTRRNGTLFMERDERGYPDLPLLNVSLHTGVDIREFSSNKIEQMAEDKSTYKRAKNGDVVFNKMRMWQGAVGVAPTDGLVSPDYTVAMPNKKVYSRYYGYLFRTSLYMTETNRFSHGIVPDRNRLYWDQFKQMGSIYPPLDEQFGVVSWLDRETAKIDALIEKKRRLIGLLEEKRAAIISHAVTKGLDPDAPMKDSGVEWLGEIPARWNLLQLRRVINKFVDYRGSTPEKVPNGIPLITAKNIKMNKIDFELSQEFIREEDYNSWMVRGLPEIGDVLVTTEAPLGESAQIVDPNIALAQRIILLKADKVRITNDYLKYHFASSSGKSELWSRATGSTALGIKASRFKETLLTVPPIKEQQMITELLDRETLRNYKLVSKINEQINKLQEYRTAMISAAVTGKIDVREVVKEGGIV
ncbi:restriction endonuclease subunit S [Candidatus Methanocrinis natronophilus]|uniref:Restriction endonuclease subunit S n=1 Tax=Candidatus Methanocrinis natronophilus TaxID=3033396 RepID=A0ABT5XAP2_9EURY|nr:restriction endonuclease subunit S [Candidatus Methanocrinis natronophilus]MDF0591743.1 restriction endonuclease subunit S [Candidatus Methanocrinis natronophilus]